MLEERFSQQQRLALERWMLSRGRGLKQASCSRRGSSICEAAEGAFGGIPGVACESLAACSCPRKLCRTASAERWRLRPRRLQPAPTPMLTSLQSARRGGLKSAVGAGGTGATQRSGSQRGLLAVRSSRTGLFSFYALAYVGALRMTSRKCRARTTSLRHLQALLAIRDRAAAGLHERSDEAAKGSPGAQQVPCWPRHRSHPGRIDELGPQPKRYRGGFSSTTERMGAPWPPGALPTPLGQLRQPTQMSAEGTSGRRFEGLLRHAVATALPALGLDPKGLGLRLSVRLCAPRWIRISLATPAMRVLDDEGLLRGLSVWRRLHDAHQALRVAERRGAEPQCCADAGSDPQQSAAGFACAWRPTPEALQEERAAWLALRETFLDIEEEAGMNRTARAERLSQAEQVCAVHREWLAERWNSRQMALEERWQRRLLGHAAIIEEKEAAVMRRIAELLQRLTLASRGADILRIQPALPSSPESSAARRARARFAGRVALQSVFPAKC